MTATCAVCPIDKLWIGRLADSASAANMMVQWQPWLRRGRHLVANKDDVVALAHLIRYSEEEALRLGAPGLVVECLRMAALELSDAIEEERAAAAESRDAISARMN